MKKILKFFNFLSQLKPPVYVEFLFKTDKKYVVRGIIVDSETSGFEVKDIENNEVQYLTLEDVKNLIDDKVIILRKIHEIKDDIELLEYEDLFEKILEDGKKTSDLSLKNNVESKEVPHQGNISKSENILEEEQERGIQKTKLKKIPNLKLVLPSLNAVQKTALSGRLHKLNTSDKWEIQELSLMETAGMLVVGGKVTIRSKESEKELVDSILTCYKEISGKEPKSFKIDIQFL